MAKYNPFNPNSVVVPNLFAGRSKQLDEICSKLSRLKNQMPSSFFIHGERGIGKTALAKLILYISTLKDKDLHELNLLTSYYSVEKGQDVSSVLEESVNKLTNNMEQNLVDRISKRVGDLFKNGKFKIGAYGASASFEATDKTKQNITIKDQTVSILSNIIGSLSGEEKENSPEGILIVIDEVHNLANLNGTASILRNIITTLDVDRLGQVSFLLVGYSEDLEEFFKEDSSARRTFDLIKLDVMPEVEAIDLLKKGFDDADLKYDEETIKKNIAIAGGYPHSIQIIGHQLIEADKDGVIKQDDWASASLDAALILRHKEFSSMFSFEKKNTIKDDILIFMANENSAMTRKEISSHFQGKNIYQYISQLKKSGAIKEDDDQKISLQSQLFRTAILFDEYVRKEKLKIKPKRIN